ncbi:hypothetical protein FRC09_002588 [Ceratobasidium sp. 395]|nr:hypothetical protein FRC09_002588 [Ceratobasidium sp. 395]
MPFDRHEREAGQGDRKRLFNQKISGARVIIERTFGQLKNRFPSLYHLGPVRDMKDLYRAVEALMILFNMCHDLHDRADGFKDGFIRSRIDRNEEVYDHVEQEPDIGEMNVNDGEDVFGNDLLQGGLL